MTAAALVGYRAFPFGVGLSNGLHIQRSEISVASASLPALFDSSFLEETYKTVVCVKLWICI